MEKTYLEILNELYELIESDTTIPQKDRDKIIMTMKKLHDLLWSYSA